MRYADWSTRGKMSAMDETRLHVAGAAPYDVVVGHDVLDQVPAMLGDGPTRVALCYPETLPRLAQRVIDRLEGRDVLRLELPEGEIAKTAAVAVDCWEKLGNAGFTRSDAVVAVGGGATTDMGGFVAATWLRGVPVVHVPTTVLGMVDAAVGGKTGMNTGAGKNLVGAFYEPAGVVCDLDALGSLPGPELVAGLGEVVKCGFIADPEILVLIDRCPADALEPRSSELRQLIERAIAVKIAVVVDDLKEVKGTATGSTGHPGREVLNYGHTMAHAIEKASGYRIRHGEAVALGMVYAAELARLSGRLDDDLAARHATALAQVGLPTSLTGRGLGGLGFEELLATMRVDKKARGAHLRFVVLDGLAQPGILADPSGDHLRAAYDVLVGR
jgi:3-dehydroquinate synthase